MARPQLLDSRLILRAAVIGTVLQLALALAGHFIASLPQFFLFGRMMLAATAGYLYGLSFGAGYGRGALGGAIAGGLCAVAGLTASVVLGETPAHEVSTEACIALLMGAVGGAFGQMGAILRKLGM
jgi:hypothetical protein